MSGDGSMAHRSNILCEHSFGDQSGDFHGEKGHLSDLCKEVERRYKAYESKARIDLVEMKYCSPRFDPNR